MGLGYVRGMDGGDSGEELGEVSGTEVVSKVEMVVVGEESVDSDAAEETLSRCWKERQGSAAEAVLLVVAGCAGEGPSSLLCGHRT